MSSRRGGALILGHAIGQLSVVAVVPLLTRTYDPAVLGGFQIALALATTVQPLASLRTEFVIPSATHQGTAHRLRRLAMIASAITVALTTVGAMVFAWLGHTAQASVAAMTALLIVALVWTVVDNAVLVRAGATRRLALRNALAGVVSAALQLVVAASQADVVYLAIAMVIGRGIAILCTRGSAARLDRTDEGDERRRYTASRAILSVSSGMTAAASSQLLTVSSGITHGAAASGYVGVAQRIAGAPILLLGQGISQALQSSSSALIRSNTRGLSRLLRKHVVILAALSAVTSAALIILAPPLAVPLLGEGWEPAGTVIAILAVPLSFQLLIGPLMPLLPMLAREALLLSVQLVRLTFIVSALAVSAALGWDLYGTAMAYGVATVVGYLVMVTVVFIEVRKYDREADESGGPTRESE